MKKIGLNIGQRTKLLDYIKKKNEINIDEKSSKEEVTFFLKNKLNFSDNFINKIELDGEDICSLLEINEIEESQDFKDLTQEEKTKLISLVKEIREGNQNKNINIKNFIILVKNYSNNLFIYLLYLI